MNDAQRELRLRELLPLKDAMMEANDRASRWCAPVHTKTKKYGMREVRHLRWCIDGLTIKDEHLKPMAEDFLKQCEIASAAWLEAFKKFPHDQEKRRGEYVRLGGQDCIGTIRQQYEKLSRYLEQMVA